MADSPTSPSPSASASASASVGATAPAGEAPKRATVGKLAGRLVSAGARIARQHAADAQREAERDLQRLLTGLAACVVGAVFALHGVIFLHALAVALLLLIPGAQLALVLGGVLGGDLLIALVCVLTGVSMIRRPLLQQTRATLREVQAFLAPE